MLIIKGEFESYAAVEPIQACLLGEVMIGIGLFSANVVAIKCIRLPLETSLPETPLAEICFSPFLRTNEHFVQVTEVVHQDGQHFIISEYANGEDLLELYPEGMEESVAAMLIKLICKAIVSCHNRGIALQDFSLENCLLCIKDLEGKCDVKICDPGQACLFKRSSPKVNHCGMVGKQFRPPEIFETGVCYDPTKVDSWCLGWSAWYLLFATPIFEVAGVESQDERYHLFLNGDIAEIMRRSGIKENSVSNEAVDFVIQLMQISPDRRMSVIDALDHPFLKHVQNQDLNIYSIPLPTDEVPDRSAQRIMLNSLSFLQGLERYRMFRYHLLQFRELADAFKRVWEEEFAAKEQKDAMRVLSGGGGGRRRYRYNLATGCSITQGESKALRVADRIRKHAPYIPSLYRDKIIPGLTVVGKPSYTLTEKYTRNVSKTTAPSQSEDSPEYISKVPMNRPAMPQATRVIAHGMASMIIKTDPPLPTVTPESSKITISHARPQTECYTSISPYRHEQSVPSDDGVGQGYHLTPRLQKRGGSSQRIMSENLTAKREIHTVASTSLLQKDPAVESTLPLAPTPVGRASTQFKPEHGQIWQEQKVLSQSLIAQSTRNEPSDSYRSELQRANSPAVSTVESGRRYKLFNSTLENYPSSASGVRKMRTPEDSSLLFRELSRHSPSHWPKVTEITTNKPPNPWGQVVLADIALSKPK